MEVITDFDNQKNINLINELLNNGRAKFNKKRINIEGFKKKDLESFGESIKNLIEYTLKKQINNIDELINIISSSKYLDIKLKNNLVNHYTGKNEEKRNENNLKSSNFVSIKDINNKNFEQMKQVKKAEQNNKEINDYINIIKSNIDFINNNIKPTESAKDYLITHITDTHGDSLAVIGSLKQSGFIGELKDELLYYDIKEKRFLKKEELPSLDNMTIEEFENRFAIIPDFGLPEEIPNGTFVSTGDIEDRGTESIESFLILKRTMELYEEKYKKEYLEQGKSLEEAEKMAKEAVVNKFIIVIADHDLYGVSKYNESSIYRKKAKDKLKKELKVPIDKREEDYTEDEKNKYDEYMKEFMDKDNFNEKFNAYHSVMEDIYKRGYINSNRFVKTNDENLKAFACHSYTDANSVALAVMAAIFPYNEDLYGKIDKNLTENYINNL